MPTPLPIDGSPFPIACSLFPISLTSAVSPLKVRVNPVGFTLTFSVDRALAYLLQILIEIFDHAGQFNFS